MRSETFAALVSKLGFLKRALVPLGGHVQRPSWGHDHRSKLGIFIDEQGGTSVESLLKGAMAHESLRRTVLSDTDKSC